MLIHLQDREWFAETKTYDFQMERLVYGQCMEMVFCLPNRRRYNIRWGCLPCTKYARNDSKKSYPPNCIGMHQRVKYTGINITVIADSLGSIDFQGLDFEKLEELNQRWIPLKTIETSDYYEFSDVFSLFFQLIIWLFGYLTYYDYNCIQL